MADAASPVELVWRGRCLEVPGGSARRVSGNAWEVDLPRTEEVRRLVRLKRLTFAGLEKHTFRVGDAESWSVVGTHENAQRVRLTILVEPD